MIRRVDRARPTAVAPSTRRFPDAPRVDRAPTPAVPSTAPSVASLVERADAYAQGDVPLFEAAARVAAPVVEPEDRRSVQDALLAALGARAQATSEAVETMLAALGASAAQREAVVPAVVLALDTGSPANAEAALENLLVLTGQVGTDAPIKALRRQLEKLVGLDVPVSDAPPELDARAVFAATARAAREADPSALSRVKNPKAFVTAGGVGDFLTKGAHIHVELDRDLEVVVRGERRAGEIEVVYGLWNTAGIHQVGEPVRREAVRLVASRLGTDEQYRQRLKREIDNALRVARQTGQRSGVLDGARLLSRLLGRTLPPA